MRLPPSAWRGIAALILAFGLAATIIILAVETAIHTGPISTEEASLLSTVLGATIGAIAVYLGGHTGPDPGIPPADTAPQVPSEELPAPTAETSASGSQAAGPGSP